MKALLQQAMDALEYHTEQTRPIQRTAEAMAALQAAIAKPEPEPVFWWDGDTEGLQDCLDYKKTKTCKHPLYREPPDVEALRKELQEIKANRDLIINDLCSLTKDLM